MNVGTLVLGNGLRAGMWQPIQSFLGLTGPCSNFRVEHNTVVRTLAGNAMACRGA